MITVTEIMELAKVAPRSFWNWLKSDWTRIPLVGLAVFFFYRYDSLELRADEFFLETSNVVLNCQNEVLALRAQVESYEGCRTGSPFGDPPIRVTFADGIVAYINFFQQIRPMDPEACTTGYVYFPGDGIVWEPVESQEPLSAVNCETFRLASGPAGELHAMTLAMVIGEMESLTFEEARANREEVSARVRDQVSSRFEEFGVQLEVLHFLEFCAATDVGG